jgi:hypothetical protein
MKVGDLYTCIKDYEYNGTLYFTKDELYIISELENDVLEEFHNDHIFLKPFYDEDYEDECDMFMFRFEMSQYFKPSFKFGR